MEGGELFDLIVSLGKMKEDFAKFVFFQMLLAVRLVGDALLCVRCVARLVRWYFGGYCHYRGVNC